MLSISINKDVEQYQEAVVAGMNGKQTFSSIIMIVIYVAVFLFCYFVLKWNMLLCIYVPIPFCIPVILTGFGTKNGMSFWERSKRSKKAKLPLAYASHENRASYNELLKKAVKQNENSDKNEFENQVKKFKRMGIVIGILTILLIIGAIVLKIYIL